MRKNVSKAVKRYVKKQLRANIENKYAAIQEEAFIAQWGSIPNTWVELPWNISQGNASYNRIGNEVRLRSFLLDGVLAGGQSNLATDDNLNTVRIVVAYWTGAMATPLQTNSVSMYEPINQKTSSGVGLVKKIMDKIIVLRSPGLNSTGYMPAIQRIKKYIRLHGRKLLYPSDVSAVPNTRLVVSMTSDSGFASHPGFLYGRMALSYEDA